VNEDDLTALEMEMEDLESMFRDALWWMIVDSLAHQQAQHLRIMAREHKRRAQVDRSKRLTAITDHRDAQNGLCCHRSTLVGTIDCQYRVTRTLRKRTLQWRTAALA